MESVHTHTHQEVFEASAHDVFRLLHTPSAIRVWWNAQRAVILPGEWWSAAWGDDEDNPDYVTVARIREFDPPRRMVLGDYQYYSSAGPLPFEAEFQVEFSVESAAEGTVLRVVQTGFPATKAGQEFRQGCETGWRNTFAGIRSYLARS